MQFLSSYYSLDQDEVVISAAQGSAFAKGVAGDFNPIHDPESRRFCVPGDLLFAIAIQRYGIYQSMAFEFLDLLGADIGMRYPEQFPQQAKRLEIFSSKDKPTLGLNVEGANSQVESQQESLIKNYVAFSGHNFPDILVPLMREQNVMFNPARPLVIYQNMQLNFQHLKFKTLDVELAQTSLVVNNKRGDATLNFKLKDEQGKEVGEGAKTLILSGLREYKEEQIQEMRDEFYRRSTGYKAAS